LSLDIIRAHILNSYIIIQIYCSLFSS